MDNAVIDRRGEARIPGDVLRMPQATLRPGCPVEVIDLSPQGIQVQSLRPLRPGSRVLARVVVGDQTVTLPATVFWCLVWAVHPEEGVTYRGGLRFEELCLPVWEELARGGHLLHAPPQRARAQLQGRVEERLTAFSSSALGESGPLTLVLSRDRLAISGIERVSSVGSTPQSVEAFVLRVVRQLTAAGEGVLDGPRFLICDRDRKWSIAVRNLLETSGVRVIQAPFRALNCNAHAERFVRSVKEECLDWMIPLDEQHLRRALTDFVVHYHRERVHQGLDNELIDGVGVQAQHGRVRRRQRIGGLLSYYYRAA